MPPAKHAGILEWTQKLLVVNAPINPAHGGMQALTALAVLGSTAEIAASKQQKSSERALESVNANPMSATTQDARKTQNQHAAMMGTENTSEPMRWPCRLTHGEQGQITTSISKPERCFRLDG